MKRHTDKSLVDDVRASLVPARHGFPAWYERIDAATRREVDQIKELFTSGKLDTKAFTLARVLSAKLAERGLITIKPQTISRWLRNAE